MRSAGAPSSKSTSPAEATVILPSKKTGVASEEPNAAAAGGE